MAGVISLSDSVDLRLAMCSLADGLSDWRTIDAFDWFDILRLIESPQLDVTERRTLVWSNYCWLCDVTQDAIQTASGLSANDHIRDAIIILRAILSDLVAERRLLEALLQGDVGGKEDEV